MFVFFFQVFEEIHMITDNKMLETLLGEYSEETTKLWDTLMGLELQLVDQLEVRTQNNMYQTLDINLNGILFLSLVLSQARLLRTISSLLLVTPTCVLLHAL